MAKTISPKMRLIGQDLTKIGKGALIASAGTALFYILEALPGVDFGKWTPIIIPFLSVITNLIRKWWNKNKY